MWLIEVQRGVPGDRRWRTSSGVEQDRGRKTSTKNDRRAVGGELGRLFSRETYLIHGNWVGEPLEIERSHGIEVKELPNAEVTYGRRNGDVTRGGHRTQTRRQLDRRPKQIPSLCHWLPDAN